MTVPIARTARDWQKLVEKDSIDYQFFADVREFVGRGCKFYRLRRAGALSASEVAAEKLWLEQRLEYLSTCDVTHEKAITLQGRLLRHYGEWLEVGVCVRRTRAADEQLGGASIATVGGDAQDHIRQSQRRWRESIGRTDDGGGNGSSSRF